MKILHTADWHIGKHLYNISLYDDFEHFVEFLIKFIVAEKVDLILVSGDIFDSSVPSNLARTQYYNTLSRFLQTGVKVVITAGNHDSISQIEAPKELLERINVFVVGDAKSVKPLEIDDIVVLPVPYLYDKDIKNIMEEMGENDRVEAVKKGIVDYFTKLSSQVYQMYPKKKIIAMGHLFMQGVKESDSERDIQVGKQAAIPVNKFDGLFDYLALGHIHKPQALSDKIRYSGSPISLSFSEKDDQKGFILIEIKDGEVTPQFVEIPNVRRLIKIKGSFTYVQQKLQEINYRDCVLSTLVDVEIVEEKEDPSLRLMANEWLTRFKSSECQIASYKIIFTDENYSTKKLTTVSQSIEEMNPRSVFIQKMEDQVSDENDKKLLLEAFDELYEEILHP